ncbi:MAG: hypothetical protein LBV06_09540 [Propionibacteriaceae bacterium]|jgi:ABC-2 type transport system permease protein|nr:hypothetical protein [Propionibacteriaceae bacterium]
MSLYQMNLLRRRGKSNRSIGVLSMFVILLALIVAYSTLVAHSLAVATQPAHLEWLVLAFGLAFASFLIFVTSMYTFDALLFSSTDTDQLFAYPVAKWVIIVSKISGLVIQNWIMAAAIFLPCVGVYAYFTHPGPVFYLYAVICWVIVPGVPLCAMGMVSYVVGLVASGTRFKQYLNIVLTLGLMAGLILSINVGLRRLTGSITSVDVLMPALERYYPPIGYAASAMRTGSAVDLLIAIAWNILPFIALAALIARSYASIRSRTATAHRSRTTHVGYQSNSVGRALLRKEVGRLLGSPTYLLNTCIGAPLLVVVAALGGNLGNQMHAVVALLEHYGLPTAAVTLILFGLVLSITNTAAPSISLEGRDLWILQSLPVSARSVLRAKLALHCLLIGTFVIVAAILSGVTMRTGFMGMVTTVVPSLLLVGLSGHLGLILNLRHHAFDFANDTQVVKSSASVLLTMLFMAVVVVTCCTAYWLFGTVLGISFTAYWWGLVVLLAAANVVGHHYLMTAGVRQFERLG